MSVCAAPLKLSAGKPHVQNRQRPKIMFVCPASVQIAEKDAMFCRHLVLLNSKDCEYIKPFCHFFFSNCCTTEQCLFFCLVSKQALLPAMFKNEFIAPQCLFCSPLLKGNRRGGMSGIYLISLKEVRNSECFYRLFLLKHTRIKGCPSFLGLCLNTINISFPQIYSKYSARLCMFCEHLDLLS